MAGGVRAEDTANTNASATAESKVETNSVAAVAATTTKDNAANAGATGTIIGGDVKPPEVKVVVPDKYDLKLPKDSPLGQESVERIASLSKERKLSQEQAQALLETESDAVASYAEMQKQTFAKQVGAWAEQTKTDKEIGGDNFAKNAELAKRVLDKYGSPELKKALNDTGLGNHPELVRVFTRIAQSMKEDNLVLGGAQGVGKKSIEELFYGNAKTE